jgi:hypothetical protein
MGGDRRTRKTALAGLGAARGPCERERRPGQCQRPRCRFPYIPANGRPPEPVHHSRPALGEMTGGRVKHYEELAALLQGQVGVPPAAETTALYERLTGQA